MQGLYCGQKEVSDSGRPKRRQQDEVLQMTTSCYLQPTWRQSDLLSASHEMNVVDYCAAKPQMQQGRADRKLLYHRRRLISLCPTCNHTIKQQQDYYR